MTELDRPIREQLRTPHVAVDALWSRIETARSQRHGLPLRSPARAFGVAAALGAVFALAALAVIFTVPRARELGGGSVAASNAGPLVRSNGELLNVLETRDTSAALEVALSDRSRIRLEPGAKLVTERSDGTQLRVALERGKASFDVKPGGPRRWVVDAGDIWLEVIGTRFSVERAGARVTVAVERGRVAVRGARVPGGRLALGKGERLVVEPPPSAAKPAVDDASSAAPGPPAALPTIGRPAAGPSALARPSAEPLWVSADQLLKASDVARAERDYRRAARDLTRFLTLYPSDTRAAIVALTLGRLQLDQLSAPKAAALSFARADRLGLPDAVAEEGAARLVEAYAKSGEKVLARAAAARYGRRFPDGPRSANVTAWLDLDSGASPR